MAVNKIQPFLVLLIFNQVKGKNQLLFTCKTNLTALKNKMNVLYLPGDK